MTLEEKRLKIIEENRRKAIEFLRTSEVPQGHGSLYRPEEDNYCALGQMGLAVGIDAKVEGDAYEAIGSALGMDYKESRAVWRMNDLRHNTLREIADYLAAEWDIQ